MPFATQTTQAAEDISAVLGRFQAWAGTPAKPGTDAREISYEEAVQSSRYRRTAPAPLPTLAAKPSSGAKEKAKAQAALKTTQAARPQEKPAKTTSQTKPGNVYRKTAPGKTPRTAQKSEEAPPQFRQILKESVAAGTVPVRVKPASIQPKSATQSRPVDPARPVTLSVRLSGAEQAFIRARAQEANVSVSAYMRQCALEVEQLRDQVERTLAAMQRPIARQPQAPGFFVRIARRLFGPGTGSTLAVRA